MRTISKEYHEKQEYYDWAETQFFKDEQIQEVISTEYPDKRWAIDKNNLDFLLIDINNLLEHETPGYSISLMIKSIFEREGPPAAKKSYSRQFKTLDTT